MQALNVKHALIVTHHSFVAPPNEATCITTWGANMVEQEGAAMAQQAMLHGIPYMKVRGVVNSYAPFPSRTAPPISSSHAGRTTPTRWPPPPLP
jgi:hypothetical protein